MNLVTLLPMRPEMDDKQLGKWLFDHGGRGREVLTYRKVKVRNPLTEMLEPVAECTCSVCGSTWQTQIYGLSGSYPEFATPGGPCINGLTVSCPQCGAKVEAAYYTRLRRHPIKSTAYPWEIVKKEGRIIFICWAVDYQIDDTGATITTKKRNAYMLDVDGKWHKFTAMDRWCSAAPLQYFDEWWEAAKFAVSDFDFSKTLPHDPAVYEGTLLENAKLEYLEAAHTGADLILYARIYQRHPAAENIAMNSPGLMAAAMKGASGPLALEWVNWKKKKPHEMLYMEKPQYRAAAGLSAEDSEKAIGVSRAAGACDIWGIPKSYAGRLGAEGANFALTKKKNKTLRQWGLVAVWNYILKTAAMLEPVSGKDSIAQAVGLCVDYWADMEKAGFDTESRAVVFPKNVAEAHAVAVAAIKYQEDDKLRKRFAKMAKTLEPLKWEADGLLIIPAENESQLIAEGKTLSHCVGRYGEAHCNGNSIFFIRRADAPGIPFFTLQLNTKLGQVSQNRGYKNCAPEQDVRDFTSRWLSEIVAPWVEKKQKTRPPERATA